MPGKKTGKKTVKKAKVQRKRTRLASDEKPRLMLVGGGRPLTADDVAAVYKHLTGKTITAEQRKIAEARLSAGKESPTKATASRQKKKAPRKRTKKA